MILLKSFLIIFCGFTLLFSLCWAEDGYFTIIGSRMMRKDKPYRISVHHEGYTSEKTIEIGISGDKYNETKQVKLINDGDKEVIFDPPSNMDIDYALEVKSLSGDHFRELTTIQTTRKQYSVFIQTDKSIYKPADKVQFRVLVLDGETRCYKPSQIEIYITDGAENRVKQFHHPKIENGVFQNELKLSDLPAMGMWKINVRVNNEEEISKEFEVAEYTLPNFEFKLDVNPNTNFKDGKIVAKVQAMYTFGKIVRGNATVTAVKQIFWLNRRSEESFEVTKTVDIDGPKIIEFDIEKELGITNTGREKTVYLRATFTEQLTGKTQNASVEVQIYLTPHKIEINKIAKKFKPGFVYKISAVVQNHYKNTPITDNRNAIKFTIKNYYDVDMKCIESVKKHKPDSKSKFSYFCEDEEYDCREERSYELEKEVFVKNGIADLELNILSNTTKIDVKAKYFDAEDTVEGIERAAAECEEYIQANLLTQSPSIKKNVVIEVEATKNLEQLTYQVVNVDSVIQFKTVSIPPTKRFNVTFQPTDEMIPKSKAIIYYIASNGELISDMVEIEFARELKNQIELNLSKNQLKPGDNLEISISTQPNSFVGLLGVDQSILLLKKGNDIEQSDVFEELEKYDELRFVPERTIMKYYDDFTNMIFLTNVKSKYQFVQKPLKKERRPTCGENFVLSYKKQFSDSFFQMRTIEVIERIKVRKLFPETWIFDNIQFAANETSTKFLTKKVPDTITSWIITGFSLNTLSGLGLTKEASKLNVFLPFFVSTNLPYSIKRGEIVAIPITVFNYLNNDQDVEVTFLNKNQEFEFVEMNEEENQAKQQRRKRTVELQRVKSVHVKSNEGLTVKFMIKPLKVGHISIKVNAKSNLAGDGVEQQLRVIPEGVTQYKNEANLIDLRDKNELTASIDIVVPNNALPDSTKIEVAVSGDILRPAIENLDKLIKQPAGSGEQNMVNFVPNIVVLDYLISVGKLTQELEKKAKTYLETGYQRELTYKRYNGSYSAFGKSDNSGSTWLTAFVAKSFNQASKYIYIDRDIIKDALNFLKNVQKPDGSFPEVGKTVHSSMQCGSSKGIALTAYTLITFLENEMHSTDFSNVIEKGVEYILNNMEDITDNYSLAIATYAMQLTQNNNKNLFLQKLNEKSINEGGMKYWTHDGENSNKPNSINTEMTAYALKAYLIADRDVDAMTIGKWLIKQRNENGGFQSTQDTAVRHFEISAVGSGLGLLQVSYRYNVDNSVKQPRFMIKHTIENDSNSDLLHMTVCTSFIPDASSNSSNMAVMELNLPSGFAYDTDYLDELRATQRVKKVELKNGDTLVILYFDDIDSTEICPELKAYRTHGVTKQKPSPIIVYDYYDNSRAGRTFYNPPSVSMCDICGDGGECADVCET